MSIARLLCKLFGHKLVQLGEEPGIAGAHGCTRCDYYTPAVDWNAIAYPNGPMASPAAHAGYTTQALDAMTRSLGTPKPKMKLEQKQPSLTEGEWQAAMLTEAKRTNELLQKLIRQGDRIESCSSSITMTRRGGPIPHIPQPSPGR